ncbi:hypothetical protein BOX15_Mlig005510g1 [Macrostomum lignano]|uniref:Mab-21-like HhH/H2TH-like domain-containing protein n=2 Tax=Macrostomum lignano TaxID=282301 RepID=A0A267FDB8_9PLAT|nr:hypothetical protein BOX15_Mlig005510g1 [Macrostomum lignano]
MKTKSNAKNRSYGHQIPASSSGDAARDPGRVLFNGLTSEKTIIEEPSPAAEALERLCPTFVSTDAEASFQETRRYLDRICQEMYYKLHVNNYRINYETPVVASTPEDLVWGEDERLEILLPLRLPQGYPLRIQPEGGPGLIGIKIPAARQKPPTFEKDPLDFLKSSKRYVSSSVTLKSTWKLVNNAMQQISARYESDLTVQQVEINREAGSIDVTLTVTSRYLDTQLAAPPPGKSDASGADDEQDPVSFAIHVEDAVPEAEEDTQEEENVEEDEAAEDDAVPDILEPGIPATVVYISNRRRRGKVPEVTTRVLHLRFMPVIRYPSDEHAYLTPRPYSFGSKGSLGQDLWTVQYSMEEALLMQSLSRADRGLRLRVWRGLTEFCREQPELRCVSRDMLKHVMFHLAETEIDLVGIRWQRANLAHYTSDILSCVRDHMRSGNLPHFFYKDVNLLQCLQLHQRRSAALKIDFYVRKETAFVRALRRTVAEREAKQLDAKA